MRDERGRILPDFIVVGAMRSGTSALATALSMHPECYMPATELWFFSHGARWRRGLDWYAGQFRGWTDQPVVGEKTAAYSYRPHLLPSVPERIVTALPHAKIVWILRDPVDRAYSQYWHAVWMGVEHLPFREAIVRRERPDWRAYRDRSVYVSQVQHFLEFVPASRMHFVKFERFIADQDSVMCDLFDFLGADPSHRVPPTSAERIPRKGRVPRSRLLARVGAKLRWNAPGSSPGLLHRLNTADHRYPPLAPELRAELAGFFRIHNAALAERVGFDISGWRSG